MTLKSPAATSAAALAGLMACSWSPMVVAATMKGSEVAWSRPAAATSRVLARAGRYRTAGSPRTISGVQHDTDDQREQCAQAEC
jgi:hypothetical protein